MGDNVKGLDDCLCVPLSYDRFSATRGDSVNQILNTIAMMPEVIEMVACPTFMSHTHDGNSYLPIRLLPGLYPGLC